MSMMPMQGHRQSRNDTWYHVEAIPAEGVRTHYVRRVGTVPVVALRRDPAQGDRWEASVLQQDRISTRFVLFASTMTVVEAKTAAEQAARDAGWRW